MARSKNSGILVSAIVFALVLLVSCVLVVVRGEGRNLKAMGKEDMSYMLSSNLSFGFVQDGVQKDMDEDYW